MILRVVYYACAALMRGLRGSDGTNRPCGRAAQLRIFFQQDDFGTGSACGACSGERCAATADYDDVDFDA